MTEFDTNTPPANKDKIPPLGVLKFVCILSMVGGISMGFSYLIFGLFPNLTKVAAMQSLKGDELKLILSFIDTGRPYLLSSAILNLSSAVGAYFMFYMHKKGFHAYSVSQILLLIVPMAFIKGFPMSFLPVLLTASFILIYSGYLRFMK